ncbi:MAG: CHASE2 domain-containing protein [Oscillatoriales cyanobacterium RM1_1_9]|nr:CHASE2 domain-containing protein [Oscillatoriales cyanobacterium RM1_1_9]
MALSRGNEVPGVLVQAHMVSQLVSAVKDGRPLIWWWPSWLEILWIGVWAGIGGAIAWKFRPFWKGSLILGTSFMTLYTICYLTLWKLGGWLPLVPAGLILLAVSMTIWFQQGNQVIKKH